MTTATRSRRRTPTAEQIAKTAAKRERFKALAKTVGAMSEDQRAAIVARCGAIVTCEGRPLSNFNSCLLASQFAAVSVVGGFWQWKRAGRKIKKGETALSLWIPAKGKKSDGNGAEAPAEEIVTEGAEGETTTGGRARFIVGSVFDITQTEPDTTADDAQGAAEIVTDHHAAPNGWEVAETSTEETEGA